MFDFPMYAQYKNSPTFINLVQKFSNALLFKDVDWIEDYLSIGDATTEGLDNWGIILNQSRIVNSGGIYDGVFGMFNGDIITDDTSYPQNFFHSNFYSTNYSPTIALNNTQYSALLMLIYDKYTTNNSLSELNNIMELYKERIGAVGKAVVFETYPMSITYRFNYLPAPYELHLFNNGMLPKPAGVKVKLEFP